MIAPMSGAAPANPSVMLGIAVPEFFTLVPPCSTGIVVAVISDRWFVPNVMAETNGLLTVITSF